MPLEVPQVAARLGREMRTSAWRLFSPAKTCAWPPSVVLAASSATSVKASHLGLDQCPEGRADLLEEQVVFAGFGCHLRNDTFNCPIVGVNAPPPLGVVG